MTTTEETIAAVPRASYRRQLLRNNFRARLVSTLAILGGFGVAGVMAIGAIDELARLDRLHDQRRKLLANWDREDANVVWEKTRTDRGFCGATRGVLVCRLLIHPDDVSHAFAFGE